MGPQAASPWLAFTPHITTITRAVGLTVTVCLLAAAVERVLATGGATPEGAQDQQDQQEEPTGQQA